MTEEKEYPITIDPAILELLGPSLYTNIYYILAELIANSWDADAENVWIEVTDSEISVEDDGSGMSYYSSPEVQNYLQVARETRSTEEQAKTKIFGRPRMGRKGIGKLAALAVSDKVQVKTISGDERSGFILSRKVPETKKLTPLDESEIVLQNGQAKGTRIEMLNPEYKLPKQASTIKRNLIKFFPQVSADFCIHIRLNGKTEDLSSFEEEVGPKLETIILFGKDQHIENFLGESFDPELKINKDEISQNISLRNKVGDSVQINQKISGWIGTYLSTSGQKGDKTDFSDNFIAIYSHGKLGQFNILDQVGKNRLTEVFLVGQLFIDDFEETSLPDMALSNRQGYKSDDPRYQEMIVWAEDEVGEVLNLREKAVQKRKSKKEKEKVAKAKENEEELKESVNEALQLIFDSEEEENASDEKREQVSLALQKVGTKAISSKENARKILISQTQADKKINDCIYEMLIYNGFSPEEIIYTNASSNIDENRLKSKVPPGTDIWSYLREFFVKTFSDNKIYVFYVYSENVEKSRGAVVEQGAGWVIQAEHAIVRYGIVEPKVPLDVGHPYIPMQEGAETMEITSNDFDTFYQYLKDVCEMFGKETKSLSENKKKFEEFGKIV